MHQAKLISNQGTRGGESCDVFQFGIMLTPQALFSRLHASVYVLGSLDSLVADKTIMRALAKILTLLG